MLLVATVIVLASWTVLAAVHIGLGLALMRCFGYRPGRVHDGLLAFFLGYTVVLGLLQIWHLALPVNMAATATVLIMGVLAFAWTRDDATTLAQRAARGGIWPLMLAVLAALWLANRAIGPGDAHDSGLYHYIVIAWSEAYPVVPGLANLNPIFAYNNASMLYFAMLDQNLLDGRSNHIGNGVLALGAALLAIHGGANLLRGSRELSSFLAFVFTTPLVMIALGKEICSPKTDPPVAIVMYVAFIAAGALFGENDARRRTMLALASALLACTAVAIKITAAPAAAILWLVVIIAWWGRNSEATRRIARPLLSIIALSVAIIAPWAASNVITSGYPLYPSTALAVNVEWRPEASHIDWIPGHILSHSVQFLPQLAKGVLSRSRWLRWYADMMGETPEPGTPIVGWSWLRPWLMSLPVVSLVELVMPLAMTLVAAGFVMFRRVSGRCVRRSTHGAACLLLPACGGILAWLLKAPDARYGYVVMWALAGLTTGLAIASCATLEQRRSRGRLLALLLLPAAMVFVYEIGVEAVLRKHNPLATIPFRAGGDDLGFNALPQSEFTPWRSEWGVLVYRPIEQEKGFCWSGKPLPCVVWPAPDPYLRLRREHDLGGGFVIDRPPGVKALSPTSMPGAGE